MTQFLFILRVTSFLELQQFHEFFVHLLSKKCEIIFDDLTSFFSFSFLELPTDRDTVTRIDFLADFSSQERGFDRRGRGSVPTNGQYRMSGGFYSAARPKCQFHLQRTTSQNPTQDTH